MVDVPTEGDRRRGSYIGRGVPGTARIVVDEDRRVLVGATFTGVEVAEACTRRRSRSSARSPLDDLWHAVPAFPTRSEIWLKLLEAYGR